jgi:hypothetical protein
MTEEKVERKKGVWVCHDKHAMVLVIGHSCATVAVSHFH